MTLDFGAARLEDRTLLTFTISLNYDYDTSGFFNSAARRAILQQAVDTLTGSINESLAAIAPSGTNTWSISFVNPATGATETINNPTIPADTLVIYIGARSLGGNERGFGGPGGYGWSGTQAWGDLVGGRGHVGALLPQPDDFAPWGGSVTFDYTANWFFGATTAGITGSQTDFYSVAIHELGHVLGIGDVVPGQATSWSRLVVGGRFLGLNSVAAHGGTSVPLDAASAHFAAGTNSGGQQAAMTPTLLAGTRKNFTPLDFAALKDIGWNVESQPTVQFAAATFDAAENGGNATITLTRTGSTAAVAIVHFATADGTAKAGTDYTARSIDVTFNVGDVAKNVTVPILDDAVLEGDQTVTLALSTPTGALLGGPATAVLTILDNERPKSSPGDFDGDGRTDLSVFRAGEARWLALQSSGGVLNTIFGAPKLADIPITGDYDGDGKSDLGVFRVAEARFLILKSSGGVINTVFGAPNLVDIPIVGDFDGDGRADLAVFRAGEARWLVLKSSGGVINTVFGATGLSDLPIPADYDGDGKADLGVFRQGEGRWIVLKSSGGIINTVFGAANLFDVPIPGDYDGDGRADLAVFRPSEARWLALKSGGGVMNVQFGAPNLADLPIDAPIGALARLNAIPGQVRIASLGASSGSSVGTHAADAVAATKPARVALPRGPHGTAARRRVAQGLAAGRRLG